MRQQDATAAPTGFVPPGRPGVSRGFTLVELVAVLTLLAVVAAVGVARMSGTRVADQLGFLHEARAALRYAQKSAIAARRTVCASFTVDTVRLTIADAFGSSTCTLDLSGPGGESAYTVQGRGGANFASVPTAFAFDALGVPSQGQTIALGEGGGTIVVESGTGYIH